MDKNKVLIDIPISSLGFGCYGFGGAYGTNLREEEMIGILQEAYELGILFYDTSNIYGNTEEILGKAVKGYRDKVSIASKVGVVDGNNFNLTKKHVIKSCESSLKKLKTDYLDIYQIHFNDPCTPICETIEALEELKRQGKIRHYGIGHIPIKESLEYMKLGNVSTILGEMSAVATSRYKEIMSIHHSCNAGFIAFSVTGRGILSGEVNHNTKFCNTDIRSIDPLFKREKLKSALRITEKLRNIGNEYSKTSAQVAISWVMQKKGVMVALTGPCKLNHLKENSETLQWKINNQSIKELDEFIEKEEKNLKEITYKEIDNILGFQLELDFDKASNDLIYAIEYCVENGLLSNEKIIPQYLEILQMKKEGIHSFQKLDNIKELLKSLVSSPLKLV